MQVGLIYRAFLPDGLSYIGQTARTLEERKTEHERCLGTTPFSKALREYGTRNARWEILENNIPLQQLDSREYYYIQSLKPSLNVRYAARIVNKIKKYKIFSKSRMMAARIDESIANQLKIKLKLNNLTLQHFMNCILYSINSGFDMRKLNGQA